MMRRGDDLFRPINRERMVERMQCAVLNHACPHCASDPGQWCIGQPVVTSLGLPRIHEQRMRVWRTRNTKAEL